MRKLFLATLICLIAFSFGGAIVNAQQLSDTASSLDQKAGLGLQDHLDGTSSGTGTNQGSGSSSSSSTNQDQQKSPAQVAIEEGLSKEASEAEGGAGIFDGVTLACFEYGQCTLCDILIVLISISDFILRIFAGLALVFFIWGAGNLMLSGGNETRVKKGKDIIKATIIGAIIVLVAWQLMSFIVTFLANESIFEEGEQVQNNPISGWYNVAQSCQKKNTLTTGDN